MTQDEIIRSPLGREQLVALARDAGVSIRGHYDETGSTPQELERFFNLAFEVGAKHEREACAKVCEDDMGWLDNGGGELCAKAIRSRGEK